MAEQQECQGSGQSFGVRQLGEPGRCTTPIHRRTHVQHQQGAQVCLFFELLDDPAVGTGGDFPVDVAEIVARLIGPVLRELHGKALAGRSVQTGEEPVDDPARDDLNVPHGGESRGIEQVSACRAFHARAET